MTPTDLRDTLATVSDAVPVPASDPLAFERRLRLARRRRTTLRVAGAAAAVALVAGGTSLVWQGSEEPRGQVGPAQTVRDPNLAVGDSVPVAVDGELTLVSASGAAEPTGVEVQTIVGTTPQGVVVVSPDEQLVRVRGTSVETLTEDGVRSAHLDGDAVVYQDDSGLIRWLGITPELGSSASAQTEGERLAGAGDGIYVALREGQLVAHDGAGEHPLWFAPRDEPTTIHLPVDVGGDRIAVRTDRGLTIFESDGLHSGGVGGDRVGSLSPDGSTYARQTPDRERAVLLDVRSLTTTPVEGPASGVVDFRWAGADLLVVADGGHTLWRCAGGTDCTELYADPDAQLSL